MDTRAMRKHAALLALAFTFALSASWAAAPATTAPPLKAGVYEPPYPAPEFSLRGSDGAELKLARYRGKLVLLVFGFTQCPQVCPTTLSTLAQARQLLSAADAGRVQVVYLTVDPERDTLPRIKSYLANFDRSFIGGTADPTTLAIVRQHYGVVAAKLGSSTGSADGYGMNHSTSIFMIDSDGKLRAMMPYGHTAQDFVHDIKQLLASK